MEWNEGRATAAAAAVRAVRATATRAVGRRAGAVGGGETVRVCGIACVCVWDRSSACVCVCVCVRFTRRKHPADEVCCSLRYR